MSNTASPTANVRQTKLKDRVLTGQKSLNLQRRWGERQKEIKIKRGLDGNQPTVLGHEQHHSRLTLVEI